VARYLGTLFREQEVRECRCCGKLKDWIYANKKNNQGAKVYTDKIGSRWNSRQCPDCRKKKAKKYNDKYYDEWKKFKRLKKYETTISA